MSHDYVQTDEKSYANVDNDLFKTFIHKKTSGLKLFTELPKS